jgi:hypothetical protein
MPSRVCWEQQQQREIPMQTNKQKNYPADAQAKNRPATPPKSSAALPAGERPDPLSINRAGNESIEQASSPSYGPTGGDFNANNLPKE